jgi:hypothetical protein
MTLNLFPDRIDAEGKMDCGLKAIINLANTSLVRFYLMELVEQGVNWPAENRKQQWLPLAEAKHRASFDETEGLLEKAATSRNTLKGGKK